MFFWLPLKISFSLFNLNELFCIASDGFYFEICIILIMTLDMVFHTNVAYINKGNIVRRRKLTVKNYLKN